MTLRASILIVLFFIGLIPLIVMVFIELPSVVEKYEKAAQLDALQQLQNKFLEKKQIVESLKSSVHVLSILPAPKEILGLKGKTSLSKKNASVRLSKLVNQWFANKKDVIRMEIVDLNGSVQLSLQRGKNGELLPVNLEHTRFLKNQSLFSLGISTDEIKVYIKVSQQSKNEISDSAFSIKWLHFVSVIFSHQGKPLGLIVVDVEAVSFLESMHASYWITNDGHYIKKPVTKKQVINVFKGVPKLKQSVIAGKPVVIKGNDNQVVAWMPLFIDGTNPSSIWVGDIVNQHKIDTWISSLRTNVVLVTLILAIIILFVAHFIAVRVDSIKQQLMKGVESILHNQSYRFTWKSPRELKELSTELNSLSVRYTRICHERKESDNLIGVEKERAKIVFRSITDGIIIVDAQSRIEYINPVAEKYLGCIGEKYEGKYLSELLQWIDSSDSGKTKELVDYAIDQGETRQFNAELRYSYLNNEIKTTNLSITPVYNHLGETVSVVILFFL
ncbi:MAG: PAS domain-containing protein [Methylococcales bacterium]|jgi:PAS domain S-box-containing protein|nr:PAS domain-containing protein [Methylococcales bacterium]MBT7408594.1 PAS domain-containing protein [Methylococcales bacterium]